MYQSANVCLVFTTERVYERAYELPIPPEIMRIVQCLLKSSKTSLKNARVRDTGGGKGGGGGGNVVRTGRSFFRPDFPILLYR